jgi:putative transposase
VSAPISKDTFNFFTLKSINIDDIQVRQFKDLQEKNRRPKRMYAELSLDYKLATEIIEKKL